MSGFDDQLRRVIIARKSSISSFSLLAAQLRSEYDRDPLDPDAYLLVATAERMEAEVARYEDDLAEFEAIARRREGAR